MQCLGACIEIKDAMHKAILDGKLLCVISNFSFAEEINVKKKKTE